MKLPAIALVLVTALASTALAQQRSGPFVVAESGSGFGTLADAVNAIGSGTGTILIASGTYRDCAVQSEGSITYRAAAPGKAIFDGGICEGKAALVLRGRSATVEGLIFQNMRVPDGNGSGIRLEQGDLNVDNSLFRNSEEGILTHDDPAHAIRIDRSTFSRLGRCDRDLSCAHSIYIGQYGSLTVTRSRFEAGNGGHYVKSRAARVTIRDNSFDDSQGRLTNYSIDLSNGSAGTITNNEMVQGKDKENWSAFITVAPEGRTNDSSGLDISGNSASFVPGLDRQSTFVANWTDDRVKIGANKLAAGVKVTDRR
ncbi:MAG: right-handed parallel beta-helix repeat-containing protein [Sphingobium sp.]|uniref:right-handed parallel beta-helix repeat-containing protein n=1 Tax=Sphingobium sp. TaxID=1912891 RepID=UPI0029B78354|nr:right-handed parallel beta-helix repeat-containing protein [Sphingobium sp.]MDX3908482.1 right-handed parallel beta-helix repeat-containing protein [Sphingobium sp.]